MQSLSITENSLTLIYILSPFTLLHSTFHTLANSQLLKNEPSNVQNIFYFMDVRRLICTDDFKRPIILQLCRYITYLEMLRVNSLTLY